ncbi:MAG: T9SS type A sorting domain-containing protein [Bacteroidales bacterium]|nr:T9SS type A sorting domain-containing protein [Bacteroidales bacterium]
MKKILLFLLFLLGGAALWAQSVTLTFTGRDQNHAHVQLDRVVIANLSRGWQETIAFPDTVYTLNIGVGVEEYATEEEMKVMPNPFDGATRVNLSSRDNEQARIIIVDMQGRLYAQYAGTLQAGDNYFNISLSTPQVYVLTVQTPTRRQSLKMVSTGHGGSDRIMFTGGTYKPRTLQLKATSTHDFLPGDYMRYIGYGTIDSIVRQSAVIAQPQSSDEMLTLEFFAADAVPCPGMPTVTDHEGNVYHTVQIGSQCWTRENMRCVTSPTTGTYLIVPEGTSYTCTGKQAHWVNGDSATYAPLGYGVLYNWNAAVDTFNTAYGELHVDTTRLHPVFAYFRGHRRGICPEGWHVPSWDEWHDLEEYVCDKYRISIGNYDWYSQSLASHEGWNTVAGSSAIGNMNSTNNATGFSALPAGMYWDSYDHVGDGAYFWTSFRQPSGQPKYVCIYNRNNGVSSEYDEDNCYSVRCVIDAVPFYEEINEQSLGTPCPGMPTVTDHEGNIYHTVQIGSQCWTKENMRCETSPSTGVNFVNNTFSYIPIQSNNEVPYHFVGSITGKRAYYPYGSEGYARSEAGLWYNWNAAVDTFDIAYGELSEVDTLCSSILFTGHRRGICPEGWHIPDTTEWMLLVSYLSNHSEYWCNDNPEAITKSLASRRWWRWRQNPCVPGNELELNNSTGFTALPIGYVVRENLMGISPDGLIGSSSRFWSSYQSYIFNMFFVATNPSLTSMPIDRAYSVRCVKNWFY